MIEGGHSALGGGLCVWPGVGCQLMASQGPVVGGVVQCSFKRWWGQIWGSIIKKLGGAAKVGGCCQQRGV